MKFEYGSKSQEYDSSGTASATKVTLINGDGAFIPVFLPADKIDLSNTELLKLSLETIYQENFPQRAENEKFNTLGEKIAHFDEMIEQMKHAIEESKLANQENRELVKTVTLTLNELVMSNYEEEEGTENEEDPTTEEN